MMRVITSILVVVAVSNAFIDFDKSRLYDEKDFEGKGVVNVSIYCNVGCNIYVSVPEDSAEVAKKIFIDDHNGQQINLFDANVKDDDNHKIPHVVPVANFQVDFINQNENLKSAPIAVWVVRGDAPLFGQAEVYDADGTTRAAAPANVITILDAEPFTVSTFSNGLILPYIAITAGFDALDSPDKCTRVIQEDTQDLRGLEVRSPLFTIGFQPSDTEISMLALKDSISAFDADLDMYFMVRIEPDLDVKTTTTVDPEERTTTEESEPIKTTTAEPEIKTTTVEQEERAKTTTSEPEVKTTTEESQPEKTTTGEPDEPVKTTTLEPEEPVKRTTTEEEEPEVKTTTLEPEPPVKTTTTLAPEEPEIKTTILEPEEPIKTTTDKDEPVKTTTLEPEQHVKTTTDDSQPEPEKTTSWEPEPAKTTTKMRRTTSEKPKSSTTPYHPKSTTTSIPSSTSTMTTTTSSAGYGSLMLSFVVASAVILA